MREHVTIQPKRNKLLGRSPLRAASSPRQSHEIGNYRDRWAHPREIGIGQFGVIGIACCGGSYDPSFFPTQPDQFPWLLLT
jgi:hypothetical protein